VPFVAHNVLSGRIALERAKILPRAAAEVVADVPIVLGKFVLKRIDKKEYTTHPHTQNKTNRAYTPSLTMWRGGVSRRNGQKTASPPPLHLSTSMMHAGVVLDDDDDDDNTYDDNDDDDKG
jgi:hypothetical protein